MERYKRYKYENIAVYIKSKVTDTESYLITKTSILRSDLYDYGCEPIVMIDSDREGEYQELEKLIELVNMCRVSAVLIWSYEDIEEQLLDKLKEECLTYGIELNSYIEDIQSLILG